MTRRVAPTRNRRSEALGILIMQLFSEGALTWTMNYGQWKVTGRRAGRGGKVSPKSEVRRRALLQEKGMH